MAQPRLSHPPQPLSPRLRLGVRHLPWILLLCLGLLFALDFGCWILAESLWFEELGHSQVFWLRWGTRLAAWAIALFCSAGFIGFNFQLVQRLRKPLANDVPNPLRTPRIGQAWQDEEQVARVDGFGAMGLRQLTATVIVLALLLSLLLYHYSFDLWQTWQSGEPLLQQHPPLPLQFDIYTLGQDIQRLLRHPWQMLPLLASIVLVFIAPKAVLITEALCLSITFGMVLSSQWMSLLPAFHPTTFGIADAQFGRDISFYIFTLPLLELLRFWWVGLLLFTLLAVVILYIARDGSLSRGIFRGFSSAQQHHLYGLGGGFMATVALSHWLSRYARLYSQRNSSFFGASYTDVAVQLPVDWLLASLASVIAVVLLLRAGDWTFATWRLKRNHHQPDSPKRLHIPCSKVMAFFAVHPFLDLGIGYILLVLLVGNALPALVQQLVVLPNELEREAPYITRAIEASRQAFDLEDIEVQTFDPTDNLTPTDLDNNRTTLDNVRLWDSRPLLLANRQLQQIRLYYSFPDADIDRYRLKGGDSGSGNNQQVIIAARELDYNAVPDAAKTWVNKHMVYTHGYGFTLSPVNTVVDDGLPNYFVRDIGANITLQGSKELGISIKDIQDNIPIGAPRIYYGALTNNYVMTSTRNKELDYPSGDNNAENVYSGRGGIAIGNLLRRWSLAFYLRDWQMAITRNFTSDTKLLFRRNIKSRIQSLAPFLRYDADPYLVIADPSGDSSELGRTDRSSDSANAPVPAIANGTSQAIATPNTSSASEKNSSNLYWIVDAYTTSDRYPYSDPGEHPFNYIRNSVKVVIDAYNGSAHLYVTDADDPIIKTWQRIFPGLLEPIAAMPDSLRSHIRYPIDLFEVQSERLLTYHMTDPKLFYNREDQWQVPSEIYANESRPVAPYYLTMRLPTADQEEFVLLHPFTPVRRNNLIAWLAGRSDGENYGKLLLYRFPKQRLVYGPDQIEARINQDPQISQLISLWNRQGSRVVQGNLLVIPIEQSLLYVEPLYLEAERNSIPTLIRVIVAYGDRIVMEENLNRGLEVLFNAEAAQAAKSKAANRQNLLGTEGIDLNQPITTKIGNPQDNLLSSPATPAVTQ